MIEELLEKYEVVTKSIISELEREANIDALFTLREDTLHKLFNAGFNKEEIKSAYYKRNLHLLDKELEKKIISEQMKVKNDLKDIHLRKNVNNQYRANISTVTLFNKKI